MEYIMYYLITDKKNNETKSGYRFGLSMEDIEKMAEEMGLKKGEYNIALPIYEVKKMKCKFDKARQMLLELSKEIESISDMCEYEE